VSETGVTARPAWSVGFGVLIGLGAQFLIDREMYRPGIALYAAAVAIAVWGGFGAARSLLDTADFEVGRVQTPTPLLAAVWGLAVVATVGAIVAFDVIAATNRDFAIWTLALIVLVAVVSYPFRDLPQLTTRPRPEAVAAVVMCMAIAAVPRLLDLSSLPFGFWFDEAENVLQGQRIREDSAYRPVFIPGTFLAPAHLGYAMALSTAVFGDTVFAARFVTVAMGLVSVLAIGLVTRRLWGPWAACVAMLLLALSRWHITISRIAMHNIAVPAFALATLALLLRAMRSGRRLDWALVGIVGGLGLGFYSAFAASLLGVGALAVFVLVRHRALAGAAVGIGIAAVVLIGAVGPVLKFAQQDRDLFFLRQEQTSLFSIVPEEEQNRLIVENAETYLRSFNDRGDNNGRHNDPGRPMLSFWVAPLAIIGLALSVANLRRPLAAGLVLWFVVGLIPGILSNPGEAPNTLRSIGTMAPAYLFACLTVITATSTRPFAGAPASTGPRELFSKLRTARNPRPVIAAIVCLGLILGGMHEVSVYFGKQSEHPSVWGGHSTPETIASRLALDATDTHEVWLVQGMHAEPSTMRFFIDDYSAFERYRPSHGTILPFSGERDVLIIGDRRTGTNRDLLTSLHPDAIVTEYAANETDRPEVITIEISAESIRAVQGLVYSEGGGPEVVVANIDATARSGAEAIWSGGLVAPLDATYSLRVIGDAAATVVIDGAEIALCPAGANEATIRLGRGGHDLVVRSTPSTAPLGLQWRTGADDWRPIEDRNFVRRPFQSRGLLASQFDGEEAVGPPVFRQIDGSAHFDFWIGRGEPPATTLWRGFVTIPTPGMHRFWLNSDDPASLQFNNAQVVTVPLEGGEGIFEANLEVGTYPIQVTATDIEPWSHVRLEWAALDGPRGRIPPELLTPDFSGEPTIVAMTGAGCG